MKIIKNIILTVLAVILLLVVVGFLLPTAAHVERSVVIKTSPERVFQYVNNIRKFNDWSPWAEIDGGTQYSYSGPAEGVGAKMSWKSEHPNVGSGSQEIILSEPFRKIKTKLDFGQNGVATAYYDIQAVADGTSIKWGFDTDFGYNLIGRYFGLMLDKWIGGTYEKGLNKLKQKLEGS